VTYHLKGKKRLIIPGLLLLLALRLPAAEACGTSHRLDTVTQTSDTVRTNAVTASGDTLHSDILKASGDTLHSDILKASGKEMQPDSLIRAGVTLRSDSLKASGGTLSNDTLKASGKAVKPKTSKEAEEIHSPRKASIYSAVLPGLGQAYNKKYWKIPLIYGGFGAFGYFIGWNNKNYKQANNAYKDLTDADPATDSYMKLKQIIYYDLTKASDVASLKQGLLSSQDYFRRNRDLLIIVTAAFYGLNIIDASVDAHFFNFDISDDLTLNWEPVLQRNENQNIFCVNCTFSF